MSYIGGDDKDRRTFLGWLFPDGKPKKKYSDEDVMDLIEKIKIFNAGAIDDYLSNHVDEAYNTWKSNLGE